MKEFNGTRGEWYTKEIKCDEYGSTHIRILSNDRLPLPQGVKIPTIITDVRSAWTTKGKANAKLIAAAPELLEALLEYKKGIDHFYSCINFGESTLDSEAIQFMNESNIKIDQAISKAL